MNSRTILVVDDENAVRGYVCEVLRAAGFSVLEAADASATLSIAATAPHAIDTLLTDVVMPEIDGVKLAGLVRRLRPEVGVVYMSGAPPDELAARGLELDGSGYLRKPFGVDQLIDRVRLAGRPGADIGKN